MNKCTYGWLMVGISFAWSVAGNIESATMCACTAMILFHMEEK